MQSSVGAPADPPGRVFAGLDGLRGVAALAVLVYHASMMAGRGWLPVGPAAVDFFFALSGFVIAFSYDGKIAQLGVRGFMLRRLIRLYPLYAVGLGLGVTWAILSPAWSLSQVLGASTLGVAFLPSADSPDPSHMSMFPLNGPAWSLFFELLVNLAFALRRWTLRSCIVASALCGVALTGVALVLRDPPGAHLTAMSLAGGAARVGTSFFAGAALFHVWRSGRLPRVPLPPVVGVVVLLACLSARHVLAGYLLVVFLATPLLICGAVTHEPRGRVRSAGIWLGWLSYGIYALHAPILELGSLALGKPLPLPAALGICAAVVLVAQLLTAAYDEPVRAWLLTRVRGRASPIAKPAPAVSP